VYKGDHVVVHSPFTSSNKENPTQLPRGARGEVLNVDEDGDAAILFNSYGRHWVTEAQFAKISKTFFQG